MHNEKHLYSGLQPACELGKGLCERARGNKRRKGVETVENELTMYESGEAFTPVSSLWNMW